MLIIKASRRCSWLLLYTHSNASNPYSNFKLPTPISKSSPLRTSSVSLAIYSGEAVHHGFKSYFRGFIPFISKSALVTAASKITDVGLPDSSNQHIWGTTDWLSVGFGVMGYAVLYPLEIISLHMSAEVERDRFYRNTRECVSKIKKN